MTMINVIAKTTKRDIILADRGKNFFSIKNLKRYATKNYGLEKNWNFPEQIEGKKREKTTG